MPKPSILQFDRKKWTDEIVFAIVLEHPVFDLMWCVCCYLHKANKLPRAHAKVFVFSSVYFSSHFSFLFAHFAAVPIVITNIANAIIGFALAFVVDHSSYISHKWIWIWRTTCKTCVGKFIELILKWALHFKCHYAFILWLFAQA